MGALVSELEAAMGGQPQADGARSPNGDGDDEEDLPEELLCVACNKTFKSDKQCVPLPAPPPPPHAT
jgi:hypothetical protein